MGISHFVHLSLIGKGRAVKKLNRHSLLLLQLVSRLVYPFFFSGRWRLSFAGTAVGLTLYELCLSYSVVPQLSTAQAVSDSPPPPFLDLLSLFLFSLAGRVTCFLSSLRSILPSSLVRPLYVLWCHMSPESDIFPGHDCSPFPKSA